MLESNIYLAEISDHTDAMTKEVIFIAGREPRTELGGHSTFVRAHARAAVAAGFEPHIFCVAREAGIAATDFGVIHKTPSPSRSFRQTTIARHAPLLEKAVEHFLSQKEKGPHLIHSFGAWGCAGVKVSRNLRHGAREIVPIVSAYKTNSHEARGKLRGLTSAHPPMQRWQTWMQYFWIKLAVDRYEARAYQQSRLVLINYESVRKIVGQQFGDGLPFRKIAYASELAFRTTGARGNVTEALARLQPANAPLLVALSRHDPRKGIDVLLRALAKLKAPFRACLLGPGLLLEAHRQLAKELGLGMTTLIAGAVPDPMPYLTEADVFVLPSLEEGSGSLALLEALQAGCAVVASNIDGISEDVTDGASALLVEPGNVAALSQALERGLTDDLLRAQLSRNARETFEQRFSAEGFTSALRAVYSELGF